MRSDVFLGITIFVTKRRKTSEYRIENEVKAIIAGKEPALA